MIRFLPVLLFLLTGAYACTEPVQKVPDAETTKIDTIDSLVETDLVKETKKIRIPDYDTTLWAELTQVDTALILDMRYATTNNFVKEQLYDCGRCFLRPEAAAALAVANANLQKYGYRLKMYDCFRPLPVQQKLWDKFKNPSYVTPPSKGSMHNRGLAVDLTIVNENGVELDMGTEFDYFGKEAHHTYTGHSDEVNQNRKLLKEIMEEAGFKGIRTEWWHYSFSGLKYELSDMVWSCEHE